MLRHWVAALAVLALAGCATAPEPEEVHPVLTPSPPRAPETSGPTVGPTTEYYNPTSPDRLALLEPGAGVAAYTPAKAFLRPWESLDQTFADDAPWSYILLDRDQRARNIAFCRIYNRKLETVAAIEARGEKPAATWWLLGEAPTPGDLDDCPWLIDSYDYELADQIRELVDLPDEVGMTLVSFDTNHDYFYFDLTGAGPQVASKVVDGWLDLTRKAVVQRGAAPTDASRTLLSQLSVVMGAEPETEDFRERQTIYPKRPANNNRQYVRLANLIKANTRYVGRAVVSGVAGG